MYIWIIKKLSLLMPSLCQLWLMLVLSLHQFTEVQLLALFYRFFFLIEFLLTITFHPKNYNINIICRYCLPMILDYIVWPCCAGGRPDNWTIVSTECLSLVESLTTKLLAEVSLHVHLQQPPLDPKFLSPALTNGHANSNGHSNGHANGHAGLK